MLLLKLHIQRNLRLREERGMCISPGRSRCVDASVRQRFHTCVHAPTSSTMSLARSVFNHNSLRAFCPRPLPSVDMKGVSGGNTMFRSSCTRTVKAAVTASSVLDGEISHAPLLLGLWLTTLRGCKGERLCCFGLTISALPGGP